jgi:hypothetical protein
MRAFLGAARRRSLAWLALDLSAAQSSVAADSGIRLPHPLWLARRTSHLFDAHARVSTGGFSLVVGSVALARMLGLFLSAPSTFAMDPREPIIKSEYFAAFALIAAAFGILAIIALLLLAMPLSLGIRLPRAN